MALIACSPSQATVAGVEVSRKLLMYSVTRPAREVLFTVVSSQHKYKVWQTCRWCTPWHDHQVKVLIDALMQRMGDAVAAAVLQALQTAHLAHPSLVAASALVPLLVWVVRWCALLMPSTVLGGCELGRRQALHGVGREQKWQSIIVSELSLLDS